MDFKKEIHKINNNKDLTNEEKSKLIFKLLNPNVNVEKKKEKIIFDFNLTGCKHYKRGCLMKAFCCNEFVPCRLCHNEKMDHEIDRFKTEIMKCKFCNEIQPVSKKCIKCEEIMGKYYCNICKFWSNDDSNKFHCKDCGICRVGNREDYFHCNICNTCINISLKESHNCIQNTMHTNCTICQNDLFNSIKQVSILKCGHSIHTECLKEYLLQNNYQCPLCKISLVDMKTHWENIDLFIKEQEMPDEFKNSISYNYCNDCKKKSFSKYHFIYNKCYFCKGFNTCNPLSIKDYSGVMNTIVKTQKFWRKKFSNNN